MSAENVREIDLPSPVREILADIRVQVGELYGDRLVRMIAYGSRIRGDATPDSDLDILLVLREEIDALEEARRTSGIVVDVASRYQIAPSFLHLDVTAFENEDDPFVENVRHEGAMILECSDRILVLPYEPDLAEVIDGYRDTVEGYDELLRRLAE